jgi:glycosyltransferase involved in cell wall biosynthesis
MIDPKVSVVISTYNRREFLERSLDSVLNQSYRNLEVVVSDDCSEYNVEELLVHCQKKTNIPIIYRRNSINMGACYTRNRGIEITTGDYIVGLDDDDEFTSDRVEYLVSEYDANFSFVATNALVVSKSGTSKMFRRKKIKIITFKSLLWENVAGTQVFAKKEHLLKVGGFDESLESGQDVDLWLKLTRQFGPALRLPGCKYVMHTEHDKSRISTSDKKLNGWNAVYEKYHMHRSFSQSRYCFLKKEYSQNKFLLFFKLFCSFDLEIYLYLCKRPWR